MKPPQQERLDDLFERAALLGQRRGDRLDADRAAIEALADHLQVAAIERVEPGMIDREPIERRRRDRTANRTVALDRREVAHAAQQPIRDPRRAARAPRDLGGAVLIDHDADQLRRAPHDRVMSGRS